MALESDIEAILPELVKFRRDIHAHPELGFEEHRTAGRIAEALTELGLEVYTGIGGTGVVGVLKAGNSTASVGLRADMDALPIQEMSGLDYASHHPNIFHGCGHDGHVSMLLGAAKILARRPDFDGTVNFIFQPAEEGLGGARVMIEEGLFERFPCDRVFGIHNWPGLPAGVAATRAGPIMAAADKFEVTFEGKGAHAALPNLATDTIGAATHFAMQLKSVVAQCAPIDAMAVLSVTRIQAGHTHNVLPSIALVGGTVRTFDPDVQDRIEASLRRAAEGSAVMTGTEVNVIYDRYYPATINDGPTVDGVIEALEGVCPIHRADAPALTSEDFSFMLQARPGAYIWLGQGPAGGDGVPLHHPKFDFNDHILGLGVRIHVALARHFLRPM